MTSTCKDAASGTGALIALIAGTLLLGTHIAQGEILLSTLNGDVENTSRTDFSNAFIMRFRQFTNLPNEQIELSVSLNPPTLGVPIRFELGEIFGGVNKAWQDGINSPGLEFRFSRGVAILDLDDSMLFQDGNGTTSSGLQNYSVDSQVTPISVDLYGLDRHVTHVDLTVDELERTTFMAPPSDDDPPTTLYHTNLEFTLEVFGNVGAIPEPNSLYLWIVVGLVVVGTYRGQLPLSLKDCS